MKSKTKEIRAIQFIKHCSLCNDLVCLWVVEGCIRKKKMVLKETQVETSNKYIYIMQSKHYASRVSDYLKAIKIT